MEVRITQCQTGRFNFLGGGELSFSFYAAIYQENKVFEVDGIKCMIHYSGEPDEKDDDWSLDNLNEVFEKCLAYSTRIISTRDYQKEALMFAKVYHENFEEIDQNLTTKRKTEVAKKIAELQIELAQASFLPDDLWYYNNNILLKEIKKYTKWATDTKKSLEDTKEGSESHDKLSKKLKGYTDKIESLSSFLLKEKITE